MLAVLSETLCILGVKRITKNWTFYENWIRCFFFVRLNNAKRKKVCYSNDNLIAVGIYLFSCISKVIQQIFIQSKNVLLIAQSFCWVARFFNKTNIYILMYKPFVYLYEQQMKAIFL